MTITAQQYAQALLTLEPTTHQEEQWSAQLQALAELMQSNAQLRHSVKDPHLSPAALHEKLGMLAVEVINLVAVLRKNNQLELIPHIVRAFEELRLAAGNSVRVEAQTPLPLSPALKKQLVAALERRTGKKVLLHVTEDSALLGGLRLTIGDEQIDGTLAGRLTLLKKSLLG